MSGNSCLILRVSDQRLRHCALPKRCARRRPTTRFPFLSQGASPGFSRLIFYVCSAPVCSNPKGCGATGALAQIGFAPVALLQSAKWRKPNRIGHFSRPPLAKNEHDFRKVAQTQINRALLDMQLAQTPDFIEFAPVASRTNKLLGKWSSIKSCV